MPEYDKKIKSFKAMWLYRRLKNKKKKRKKRRKKSASKIFMTTEESEDHVFSNYLSYIEGLDDKPLNRLSDNYFLKNKIHLRTSNAISPEISDFKKYVYKHPKKSKNEKEGDWVYKNRIYNAKLRKRKKIKYLRLKQRRIVTSFREGGSGGVSKKKPYRVRKYLGRKEFRRLRKRRRFRYNAAKYSLEKKSIREFFSEYKKTDH